ncbi:MAG: hypothetical protein RSB41_02715 [Bacilli bacterium]
MNYHLTREGKRKHISYFSCKIDGLVIKNNNDKKNNMIIQKITITDLKLIDNYTKQKFDRRFTKLFKLMYDILSTEDDTNESTAVVLGEIEKLKETVENKYREYISRKEYFDLLAKLEVIETEFKNKLYEKYYSSSLDYEEKNMHM